MTTLNLYFSPTKIIKLSLISIFILLLGIYCLKSELFTIKIIGTLEIILGITVSFVVLKCIFDKNPQIIIDKNGIIDNRILKNVILWNQIEKLELTTINNQKVIKLSICENFDNENYKWLFIKTSQKKLNQKPKNVLINLDQLKIDYDNLNQFLLDKKKSFTQKNLDKNLTGI